MTSSSYSQDKFVLLNLQKYTKILSKELNVHKSFFHYVGNETKLIEKLNIDINLVIEISLSEETIISRMSGRRIHPPSGRSYHIKFNPPKIDGKDDETGEDLIQRDDDKPETVLARLEVYKKQTDPLIDYYINLQKNSDLKFIKINGANSPQEVSEEIFGSFE